MVKVLNFADHLIVHTSSKYEGQIYIREMNWVLMVLCVVMTVAIGDTGKIGNAYGECTFLCNYRSDSMAMLLWS